MSDTDGVSASPALTDEQIEKAALKSGLDEELWFGQFTPKRYEDTLPKLRRFADEVRALGVTPTGVPQRFDWTYEGMEPAKNGAYVRVGVRAVDPVREALRELTEALRQYGTFPPGLLPVLREAERALGVPASPNAVQRTTDADGGFNGDGAHPSWDE